MSKHIDLAPSIVDTVTSTAVTDVLCEYAELGIDAALSEGLLRDLPFVGTLVAIGRVGFNINDRLLIRKLVLFLGPLDKVPPQKRREMVERLESDPKYGRKVGEHLIELLDRIESHRKPQMVAAVFRAYAEGAIDAVMLHRLNYAIERLPSADVGAVREFRDQTPNERTKLSVVTLQSLMNAGLANAVSGFGSLVYEPNEVCEGFLQLNLDIGE